MFPSWIRSSSDERVAVVLVGELHHQPQVGGDQPVGGLHVAGVAVAHGQRVLLLAGEQRVAGDLGHVGLERVRRGERRRRLAGRARRGRRRASASSSSASTSLELLRRRARAPPARLARLAPRRPRASTRPRRLRGLRARLPGASPGGLERRRLAVSSLAIRHGRALVQQTAGACCHEGNAGAMPLLDERHRNDPNPPRQLPAARRPTRPAEYVADIGFDDLTLSEPLRRAHRRARLHPPHPGAGQGLRPGDGGQGPHRPLARPAPARRPPSACRCWRRSPASDKARARAHPLPHPRAGAPGGRRARATWASTRASRSPPSTAAPR